MFKDDLLKGKHILVTGGGTGLGKVMATQYASLGAHVTIAGRRGPVLEETAAEISEATGAKVTPRILDIRVAEAVDEVINAAYADQPLDGLVNNAAGNFIAQTKDLSPRGFNAIADIVMRGSFYMTQNVGKRWIEDGRKGSVISILTTWVWTGSAFTVPSAMSKAAINIMTKSLAVEWGKYGIRLNAIAPGPFPTEGAWARLNPGESTDMGGSANSERGGGNPMGRVGEMHELANLATFLMADGCDYLTGQTIAIDGALYLSGGGTFDRLGSLSDDDWAAMRDMITASNDQDKAKRSV